MKPRLERIGQGAHPVVVVDDFTGDVAAAVGLAERMQPFPDAPNYYPGLRREFGSGDAEANAFTDALMQRAAPFIGGAFDVDGFTLKGASFSMVTRAPGALGPAQRAPHFDSSDPLYLALLLYLTIPSPTGTAFYRQRSTAIERVDEANVDRFVATAIAESAEQAEGSGYIQGSDRHFEQTASFEALPDRLLIYQGSVLHSGIIPPDMPLLADPKTGRLTANFFVQCHRRGETP